MIGMTIMPIIKQHPVEPHPLSHSLSSSDGDTLNGVRHRELLEKGHIDILGEYMLPALEKHHTSAEALQRRKELIDSLRIVNTPILQSPYPQNLTTQKGNFAEIFMAEYLGETTEMQLPIYRLRYNPNPNQSMKGDDILMFDLDSNPARIIVGESKFRGTPDKQSVIDIVDGLVRSNKAGLPISLMFVAERLYQEGKPELGKKVMNCAILFAANKLQIDYVGLLMSNQNARNAINTHTSNDIKRLLMISLGLKNPEELVQKTFERLEDSI